MNRYLSGLAILAAIGIPLQAQAKDVATEQYNASAAKAKMEETKSDLDDLNEQIKIQSQRVEQEQARLKELQKKQAAAKNSYAKEKAEYETQEKALDKAWSK